MTKEDSLHERDYYTLAERNVSNRRKQQQSLLGKLRLPEPGELVRDKDTEEEEERFNQEELQKQLQEQQQPGYYSQQQQQFPGLQPPSSIFPKRGDDDNRGFMDTLMDKITPDNEAGQC